jgi:hypothetical protein
MFLVRMRFSSVPKIWLARVTRNDRTPTVEYTGGYVELWRSNLRGRRPVRADCRLRADQKHIREQSAILLKTPRPYPVLARNAAGARTNPPLAYDSN